MKKTIYLIVIVLGLGGAIVMGYMVFSGPTQQLSGVQTGEPTADANNGQYQILPYGKELNFEKVEKYNKNRVLFPYPKVSPSEIGASSETIME